MIALICLYLFLFRNAVTLFPDYLQTLTSQDGFKDYSLRIMKEIERVNHNIIARFAELESCFTECFHYFFMIIFE